MTKKQRGPRTIAAIQGSGANRRVADPIPEDPAIAACADYGNRCTGFRRGLNNSLVLVALLLLLN